MHRHALRGPNSNPYAILADLENLNLNFIPDHQFFVFLPGHDQHEWHLENVGSSCGTNYITASRPLNGYLVLLEELSKVRVRSLGMLDLGREAQGWASWYRS